MNMSRQGKGMVEARLGQSQGKAMKGHQGKVTAKSKQSQGMVKARSRESLVFHNCILFDFADFLIIIIIITKRQRKRETKTKRQRKRDKETERQRHREKIIFISHFKLNFHEG